MQAQVVIFYQKTSEIKTRKVVGEHHPYMYM